ncbi:MAG: hypothetical protein HY717_16810 [Planctomycetes bacterium]|nr:hypothetical protein [Planctomycetota bacterium]
MFRLFLLGLVVTWMVFEYEVPAAADAIVGWGGNDRGQIDVPPGCDFVAISAGACHGIALKSDGSLACWGCNDHFGVCDLPQGNDFVAIDAGFYHNLAIRADGSVVAWGRNDFGQADVPPGNAFTAMAEGNIHSLAMATPVQFQLEQIGPWTLDLVVNNSKGPSLKGGQSGFSLDPEVMAGIQIVKGPDFPGGDGEVFYQAGLPSPCSPNLSEGVIIGWINSKMGVVTTPPGMHRLLRIHFQPGPSSCSGDCSPLNFVDCLDDPPIKNLVVDENDKPIPGCTADSRACILEHRFQRGEVNSDGEFDISDPIVILMCLFVDRSRCPGCNEAADVDDNGAIEIADPIYWLMWRFLGEAPPLSPFPSCGFDPDGDGLGCDGPSFCGGC